MDDVAIRRVNFLVNGTQIEPDGSYPFSFLVDVPLLAQGAATLNLVAVAVDTVVAGLAVVTGVAAFAAVADVPREGGEYDVRAAETGEREVTFTFDGPGNRELPQIVGQLTILPKHWWEGTDAGGRKRDVSATMLEPPLGCGAYRIKELVPGRSITYERVKDYWAAKLPVKVGTDNFETIRYDYYRDGSVALEAFKAHEYDFRSENTSKDWATNYTGRQFDAGLEMLDAALKDAPNDPRITDLYEKILSKANVKSIMYVAIRVGDDVPAAFALSYRSTASFNRSTLARMIRPLMWISQRCTAAPAGSGKV